MEVLQLLVLNFPEQAISLDALALDVAVGDIDRDEVLCELLLAATERDLVLDRLKRDFFDTCMMADCAYSMVGLRLLVIYVRFCLE